MATELFLLSSGERQDAAAEVIVTLRNMRSVIVYTSLGEDSIKTVAEAWPKKHFDCIFDMDWDPRRTENSIFDYKILTNEELVSFANEMNAEFQSIDFENGYQEQEGNFERRLREKFFEEAKGAKIVVTHPTMIAACVKLTEVLAAEAPVLCHFSLSQRRAALVQSFDSWDRAVAYVRSLEGGPQPAVTAPAVRYGSEPQAPAFTAGSTLKEEREQLPQILEAQVKSLSEGFSRELEVVLKNTLSQCQHGGSDPSAHVITKIHDKLKALDERFLRSLEELETRLRGVDDFKVSQSKELEALVSELQNIQENQRGLEALISEIRNSAMPALEALEEKLKRAEESQDALKREIEEAATAKAIASYPLFIRNVEKKEDGKYYAEVVSRKFYPVYGYLELISAAGNSTYSESAITFNVVETVDLTSLITPLQPGWYEISIKHYADRSDISRRFRFSIQDEKVQPVRALRNYADSMVYAKIPEVEETVKRLRGEMGVVMLRRLAVDWLNEAEELLQEFMGVIHDVSFADEAAVRQQLIQRGIRV